MLKLDTEFVLSSLQRLCPIDLTKTRYYAQKRHKQGIMLKACHTQTLHDHGQDAFLMAFFNCQKGNE